MGGPGSGRKKGSNAGKGQNSPKAIDKRKKAFVDKQMERLKKMSSARKGK